VGGRAAGATKETAAATESRRAGATGKGGGDVGGLELDCHRFCAQPLRRLPKTAHRRRHVARLPINVAFYGVVTNHLSHSRSDLRLIKI